MTTEHLALAAFGVALLIFLGAAALLGLVAIVRAFRGKPTAPAARPAAPAYAPPAAHAAPAATQPASPTFVAMARDYIREREEERKVNDLKQCLDKVMVLTDKIAPAPPPPNA